MGGEIMGKPIATVQLGIARLGIEISDCTSDAQLAAWVRSFHRALALQKPELNAYAAELLAEVETFRAAEAERKSRRNPTESGGNLGKAEDSNAQSVSQQDKQKEEERDPWFSVDEFSKAWRAWEKSRKKKAGTRQLAVLKKLSAEKVEIAVAILNQSADNQWQGLFALKGTNGTNRTSRNDTLDADATDLAARFREQARPDRSPDSAHGDFHAHAHAES